jgi:hypothetical protein
MFFHQNYPNMEGRMARFDNFSQPTKTKPSQAAQNGSELYSWRLIAGLFLLAICIVAVFG